MFCVLIMKLISSNGVTRILNNSRNFLQLNKFFLFLKCGLRSTHIFVKDFLISSDTVYWYVYTRITSSFLVCISVILEVTKVAAWLMNLDCTKWGEKKPLSSTISTRIYRLRRNPTMLNLNLRTQHKNGVVRANGDLVELLYVNHTFVSKLYERQRLGL